MLVHGIVCKLCRDLVYSRSRHDMRSCSCSNAYIDGGRDYVKYGAKNMDDIESVIISIREGTKELVDDWNSGRNKLGIVKHYLPDNTVKYYYQHYED